MMKRAILFYLFLLKSISILAQVDARLVLPEGHTSPIIKTKISSDSKYIVSSSYDNTLKVWDLRSGRLLTTQTTHKDLILDFDISSDNSKIISSDVDNKVYEWDVFDGKIIHNFDGFSFINNVYYYNNNKEIILFSDNGFVYFLDSKTYKINDSVKAMSPHIDESETYISKDEKFMAIYSHYNDQIVVLDLISKNVLKFFCGKKIINQIEFDTTNNILYSSSIDGYIKAWSLISKKNILSKKVSSKSINSFCINDKKEIITCDELGFISIWTNNGTLVKNVFKSKFPLKFIGFLKKDEFILTVSEKNIWEEINNQTPTKTSILEIFELKTRKSFYKEIFEVPLTTIFISFDKIKFAVGSLGCFLKSYEIDNSILTHEYFGRTEYRNNSEITIQGKKLFNGVKFESIAKKNNKEYKIKMGNDGKCGLMNIKNEEFISRPFFNKENKFFSKCLLSSNGKYLCTIIENKGENEENIFELWDFSDEKIKLKIKSDKSTYFQGAKFNFNSDQCIIINSGRVLLIDLLKFKIIDTFLIGDYIYGYDISPDGNFLATVINNNYVQIWSILTHELCYEFSFNKDEIHELKFSPSGNLILAASDDGAVAIVDLKSGYLKSYFDNCKGKILSCYFNKEENQIIVNGMDDEISRLYDLKNNKTIINKVYLEENNELCFSEDYSYYMCSKDASKMLHYVTPSLKVIGFDQLDPIYNRPDIVLDSIGKYFAGGPDLKLIQQYKDAWVKRMTRLGLDTTTASNKIEVPDAEIVNADDIVYNNTSGKINFHFKASDAKHDLRRYNVYVNEVPVYGSNGISISEKVNQFEKDISLNLTEGNNKIQVSVMNDLGLENFRYPVYVQYQPAKSIVSNTYYIGIGVDSFATSKFNLQYCVKDVNDLGNLLANDKNTKTIILKNKDVTKENVLKLKSFLQQTTEQDKVIISCSSHGLLDKNNNFYLAMSNVDFNHPEQNGLAYEDLQGLLDGIPARKKLLLLDACNSGENEKSDNNGIANSKDLAIKQGAKGVEIESVSDSSQNKRNSFETMMELFVNVNNQTGATVVSAAGGKQSALEGGAVYINGKPISNGAFTYSILEYLTQHQNDKNKLTVNQLKQYAEQRVTEITNGKQKPTSRQETMEVDWGF